MTHQAARLHRQNTERLDRQLAIVEDVTRDMQARKRASRWAASLAEKLGHLIRPKCCAVCYRRRNDLERHHPDHSKPLDVVFACPPCHRKLNKLDDGKKSVA